MIPATRRLFHSAAKASAAAKKKKTSWVMPTIEPMNAGMIDMRSDTVTRPCDKMRDAMANAVVGDDIYNDCPTTNKL